MASPPSSLSPSPDVRKLLDVLHRQGSEFIVRLPLLERAEVIPVEAGPEQLTLGDLKKELAHPAAVLRVLIVDDNADSASSLAELLQIWGHQVRTAHDGPAAIQVALAFKPDVVLLDIGLPGMDGYEVARQIRAEQTLHRVLLVALTGYGQEEDRRQAEAAGFDRHFTKPVELGALQSLLEQAA